MKYNELVLNRNKAKNRVGRGIAAGQGKTAGRGTKGQGARKSGGVRPGFEGGQMPLYMRVPKLRGFKSKRTPAEVVYTGQLDDIKNSSIDTMVLAEAKLISNPYVNVKIIKNGEVKNKKDIKVQLISAEALKQIENAGGSFRAAPQLAREAKKTTKK